MGTPERRPAPPELPGPWAARLTAAAGPRYRVLGEVARGGMGRVLRVLDRRLDRVLAMKVVELGAAGARATALARRFLDEVRATSRVQHPGVVPVHDVGLAADGSLWFTMPLVRGRSLAEVLPLARRGAEGWSRERVLGVLVRVCETVAHAHERGVVHRDLKPSNVMVGRFGETYVLDWGLARVLEGESAARARGFRVGGGERAREAGDPTSRRREPVVGTPAYMAPEQRRGEEAGPAADVHALGAILYETLAGHMPYADLARDGDLARALDGPPTPLRGHRLPRELVAIQEKAMARDPRERYASALELADDLRSHLEVRVVRAYRSGGLERLRKWSARNPRLLALLALLALVLGLALADRSTQLVRVARAHERTRREAYLAGIAAAQASLRDGDAPEAVRRLALCPEPLRGFEWRHLALRADESGSLVLRGHRADVVGVAALPGGALASASADGVVRVLAAERDEERLVELGGKLTCLAARDDGTLLAAGDFGGRVHLLELPSLSPRAPRAAHAQPVTAIAFEPRGTRLASASNDGTVLVAGDGEDLVLRPPEPLPLQALAWSPDGATLAAGSATGIVYVFDAASGELRAAAPLGTRHVHALAFAPAGGELAVGAEDGWIRLLDAETLAPRGVIRDAHRGPVTALGYDAPGERLASCSVDRTLGVWDAARRTSLARLLGHAATARAVLFLPSGALVTGGDDRTLRVWRVGAAAEVVLRGHAGWVVDVAVSAHGLAASTGRDARALLWRLADGALLGSIELPAGGEAVAFRADGERLAVGCGDGRVRVHDVATGALVRELVGPGPGVRALEWAATGALVARRAGGGVLVLDPAAGTTLLELEGTGPLEEELAVSTDGARLALSRTGGVVAVHALATGELLATLPPLAGEVSALAWSPDARLLVAGSSEGDAALLDVERGARVATLRGPVGRVFAAAWSPDGSRVVTGARDDALRIHSPDAEDALAVLRGHLERPTALAFTPDGSRLVSASHDGTVRIWNARRSVPAAR